jgi:uncharacterized membrane protein (UPF0127 family)
LVAACATTTATTPNLPTAEVAVDEMMLRVWIADEADERRQGLRAVERLPDEIDGMLFGFPEPATPTFVMLDTLIPLDIWFFDAGGDLIGSAEMAPCPAEPCPGYPAPGQVRWALETPLRVYDFREGAVLSTSTSG